MNGPMIVLVCGGRDFADKALLTQELDRLHALYGFTRLIQGDAKGADALAKAWAVERGIPYTGYAADWKRHGIAAGPKRNQRMLDEGQPAVVISFPGGRGTADMVHRAERMGLNVIHIGAFL